MTGLLLRAALFALLALAALNETEIASLLFADPSRGVAQAYSLTLRSLTWFAGAFVVIAALEIFFWKGVVARLARHPVPALLKSVVALIVLAITATFVISSSSTATSRPSGRLPACSASCSVSPCAT